MKYPQLVSPRAVNAISDWLVSRLEQLGVESPQIYTRLLLSLLQSSVQVNDPIEFSNLEAFFANRKGGHKRFYLPSDTEALKKLNAVQCLREIVSNDQETATIEELVDELCEKLKDIEKQTQNLSDQEHFPIETQLNSNTFLQTNTQLQNQLQSTSDSSNNSYQHHTRHNHFHQHHHQNQQQQQQITQIYNNSHGTATHSYSKRHNHYTNHGVALTTTATATTSDVLNNDLDNDPKKRYFRAFPALSKEMEDSFRIWRRNAKSLTWPIVGRTIIVDNSNNSSNNSSASLSSSSTSSILSSSNLVANCSASAEKSGEKTFKGDIKSQPENKVSAGTVIDNLGSGYSGNIGGSDLQQQQQQQQHQGAVTSSKKKSKRRRNQALCKGKSIQNIRKLSASSTSNSVGCNKYHHYTHHRNTSPAWDTDFKGCWEMGPDLIKEFLSRQNGNKRNRNNSDGMEHDEHNERNLLTEVPARDDEIMMKRYIDLSFCCDDDDEVDNKDETQQCLQYAAEGVDYVDEDYDDNTLSSVSELAMDNTNPKRLYQRESQAHKSLPCNILFANVDGDNLNETSDFVDPLDFQQFKSKFNSSLEALWKDVESTPTLGTQKPFIAQTADNSFKVHNSTLGGGISSAFYATTSLNALAPFKKDLWNFWSNYNQQQQHYDQMANKLSTTASASSMTTTTRLDESSASSGAGADIANSSDYFSMPSNFDDFDKSVGGVRRTNEAGASLGTYTPSFNVFLQNSIWSTPGDCVDVKGTTSAAALNTEESFPFKVWYSSKKLSQLDVGNGEKMSTLVADDDVDGVGGITNPNVSSSSLMVINPILGGNLQFPPFQNLKWSEGINAGPTYGSSLRTHGHLLTHPHEMQSLSHRNASSLQADNNYASYSSAANISGATWEAPAYGQNAQPDLKSWCASNPMSLTEMYGNDVCDSIVNPVEEKIGPAITLSNHCANSSGFVAYSRIKECGLVQPKPVLPMKAAARPPKDFLIGGEEEENLLNSERTHFHPIEHFVDGHTFDISNVLDTIEFERTDSGLLRYDSDDYLEYTRNDIYMADEEVATGSTNLLKYGRTAIEDKKEDGFVIKFRLKRSGEIACQTEEKDLQLASAKMTEFPVTSSPPLGVSNMFHNTFSLSRQANNEAIMAAVTKAVAAAAKAAAENHLNAGHFCNMNAVATTACSTNTMENNSVWMPDNSICDEVDFCNINPISSLQQQQQELAQNWSMQEVEKQCHQRRCLPHQQEKQQQEFKRKFPSSVDIERSEENSLDNTSLHTLWGMCAVCNSCEYGKSMPANRLLRDELQLEADEIMSDLRYMQDLYIGESDILNETTGAENDPRTDDKLYANVNKEMEMNSTKNYWNINVDEDAGLQHDPVQVSMLQKVNQLIEDLLKPDSTAKLAAQETVKYDELIKKTEMTNSWNLQVDDHNKDKNLWRLGEHDGGNNIWQHKTLTEQPPEGSETKEKTDTFLKPMKLLKQVGGSFNEDTEYKENLSWKHDNLAKIWQQNIPTSTEIEETFLRKHKQNEMANNIIDKNLLYEQQQQELEETLVANQTLVEENNRKNLQSSNTLTPPSPLSNNGYKRVQQFFHNSATKIKIAANRKRRHSASQNLYQQQHLQYNNNNDNIADLNAYKEKFNETIKAANEQQQLHEVTTAPYNNTNMEEKPSKQTIITCKYWTTATNGTQSSMDSAAAAMMLLAAATTNSNNANDTLPTESNNQEQDVMLDDNIFGNTFSCLIDKNASILKHVTMMTRPLTR